MYTDFYHLSGRPFQLTPDPAFYFASATHRKAMAYLTYGLEQGEGFIIITGDVGAGKTTLVAHLLATMDASRFTVSRVMTTQLDADNMLRMAAAGFGLAVEGLDKSALLTRMEQFLLDEHRAGRRALLIVDEAQSLTTSALEELRMLSNFQADGRALLQTVLLGQPEFRDRLASSPELEQLRQRVTASHHLEPMTREELPAYLVHRLKLVGWASDPDLTEGALDAMYDYSGGVPRRLNNLAARVLLHGALEEKHVIDSADVAAVVEDLVEDGAMGGVRFDVVSGGAAGGLPDAESAKRIGAVERGLARQGRAIEQMLDLIGKWPG